MINIMFYCHVFYPQNSGYTNAFQNLINAILKNHPDVKITVATPFALTTHKELNIDRLNVIRLNNTTNIKIIRYFINPYGYAKQVCKLMKEKKYEILFVETFDDFIFLSSLNKKILSKTAVRVHSTTETEYTEFFPGFEYKLRKFFIQKIIMKNLKYVVSTNQFHIDFVKKYFMKESLFLIPQKTFMVIPNTFPLSDDTSIIENQDNDNNNRIIKIFSLGRMDLPGYLQKGFDDFLNALILLDISEINRFEITIVGNGEYLEILKSKASLNKLPISFINSLDHKDTLKFLSNSDVVVLPSRFEGMSMFALEALATDNIVVYSKTGGLIPMVENNGFLFEVQNIEDLSEKLRCLLTLTKEKIIEMKLNSRILFINKFSEKITADKFMNLIKIIEADNRDLV